jgi:hypothetical protein
MKLKPSVPCNPSCPIHCVLWSHPVKSYQLPYLDSRQMLAAASRELGIMVVSEKHTRYSHTH